MNEKLTKYSIIIGLIDGSIIFFLPIMISIFERKPYSKQLFNLITYLWPYIIILLLPLAIIAFWRGKIDALRILSGDSSFIKSTLEGVVIGIGFWLFFHVFGIMKVAFAAGTIYDSIVYDPLGCENIIIFLVSILPSLGFFTILGAFVGFFISVINRIIIKLFFMK